VLSLSGTSRGLRYDPSDHQYITHAQDISCTYHMIVRPNNTAHLADVLAVLFKRGLDVFLDAHGEAALLGLVNDDLWTILKVFAGAEIED